jgi:hypothetical protein
MAPQEERLKRLLTAIFTVHQSDEPLDCETCSQQFDCLVEMVDKGANLRDILPAVEEHLRCCPDCNEEFQALAAIIRAESSGDIPMPGSQQPRSG